MKRSFLPILLLAAVCVVVGATGVLAADTWPSHPIKCIVPYKAGGSSDSLVRGIVPLLEEKLGVPVVIQNQPGASSQVGVTMFLKTPADGYTLLLGVEPYMSKTIVAQGAKYSISDFAIVNAENVSAVSLSVLADGPFGSFDEFVTKVRANPGKYSCGVVSGGAMQIMAILLQEKLDLDFKIIPSNSGSPIRSDLLGKHIDFSINGAVSDATMKPEVRSLALSTSNKLDVWPDAPFINDALKPYGVELPELSTIRFFTFKKEFKEQYPERFEKFLQAYKAVLESAEYQAYTKNLGSFSETRYYGPETSEKMVLQSNEFVTKYGDQLFKKK